MLRIKDLLQIKYLTNNKTLPSNFKIFLDKDLIDIKNEKTEISNDIKKKTLLINNTIKNQENELKLLYQETNLLDQNKIQSDIINNQQKLINNHKKEINELKFNLNKVEENLKENIYTNKTLVINNNEFKNTISRYVEKNNKLQDVIKKIKSDNTNSLLTEEQVNAINNKIKFYQEEIIRLSSELNLAQNNYEIIKNNFAEIELEKNNIYKKIQDLNNSLIKNNVVGTPFAKKVVEEDSISSMMLNDTSNNNLQEDKKPSEQNKNLDDVIVDIFN